MEGSARVDVSAESDTESSATNAAQLAMTVQRLLMIITQREPPCMWPDRVQQLASSDT